MGTPKEMNMSEEKELKKPKKHSASKAVDKHIEALEAELEALNNKNKELENNYFKAYADAENIKKRNQQELEQSKKYRIQSFAVDLLPTIDNLERALESMEDKESLVAKGVQMTYLQLIELLKKEGVEEIQALNQGFDSNFHQALMSEKVEGIEANIVIEVLQKGYTLKDRLLRPSLVKVSE
jgi:molecular chaperone GrpE